MPHTHIFQTLMVVILCFYLIQSICFILYEFTERNKRESNIIDHIFTWVSIIEMVVGGVILIIAFIQFL